MTRTKTVKLSHYVENGFKSLNAQHYGEVDPGFNPPKATKIPKYKQKRSRLTIEATKQLLEFVDTKAPSHIRNAIHIAISTGQRVGDIAKMKFSDVYDGHLHVTQQKSGGKTKLAIPLSIKNPLLDESLGEIIKRCRDNVVSQSIIHYSKRIQGGRVGAAVSSRNISGSFSNLVAKSGIEYGNETPPTFHELRSVSARSYMEIGVDIQSLLGHKSQRVTERYQDNRGEEYTYIKLGSS
ncbi:integrase [Vibrio ishigakensis]|uniref:Integrase n=1 Tax=Vibrio ishigakensis TaxID=1481914 RepID=A0A0B8PG82_9VIBR|nr:integrase [Vibrio ishigakensis]